MDTGFLAKGETMDDDYDVEQPLLPEEILGIIDQLLCLEVRGDNPSHCALTDGDTRWLGIWAIHYRRPFSPAYTLRRS